MKKYVAVPMLAAGLALLGLGVYAVDRGFDARDQVRGQLLAEDLTTPAGASIPNQRVDDAATAQSFADFLDTNLKKATNGRSYAEVGHYLMADGKDTDDPAKAVLDADGKPTVNPLRQAAFEISSGTNGLYTAVMAFHIGDLAIGVGIVMLVLGLGLEVGGIAMAGLTMPAFARRPHWPHHAAPHHA